VRNKAAASVVADLFRKRATGASWVELAEFLEQSEVYPPTGNKHWAKQGVCSLVRNPVYTGQARSGKFVKENAHEPLVTRAEFDAAQLSRTMLHARDGSLAAQAMLGGLARCAGCGHTLKIAGNKDRKTGHYYPSYYCIGRYSKGPCPARASIRASTLDQYVEQQVLAALASETGLIAEAHTAHERLEEAARLVAEAEHELDLYIANPKLLTVLGEQKFLAGAEARQRALDEARKQLAELRTQSAVAAELAEGDLRQAWPTLSTQEKRRLLHGLLDRVVLRRAGARGRQAPPIGERTQIVLRGNVLLEPAPDSTPL